MTRAAWNTFVVTVLVSINTATPCASQSTVNQRPNIVFIMVDDMGYADLSSYGRKDYKTPVIDGFIREGMKFTQAYSAAPICTPSRVGLMTGRYPSRNAIGLHEPLKMDAEDRHLGLSADVPTLSSMIRSGGYETALFGKWHLGVPPEFSPRKHGFEHFFGVLAGAADYIDHGYFRNETILFENDQPAKKQGYLTDLFTDYAVSFIKGKHPKPFFLNLQFTSPHWPWQVPGDDPYPDTLDFRQGGSPEVYAGMMKNLDMNIGRVLSALKESGLEQSTIVIFTSDNGGEKFSDMGPFKGEKGSLYEGGIRVPAAVRWPGVIAPGSVSEQPMINMDWTVTMLALAKATIPKGLNLDGIDLTAHLQGKSPVIPRKFFWRFGREGSPLLQNAYRDGDWKYLKRNEGEFLFDLKADPGEKQNVKDAHPQKFIQLKKDFAALDKQMLPRLVVVK